MEIVDAHQHAGSLTNVLPRSGQATGREATVEEEIRWRVDLMDRAGVDWAVLQPAHGYNRAEGLRDTMRVNDRMAQFKTLAPTRFRAVLGVVEPFYAEKGFPEIDRCKLELGLDGLAWHHRFQGCFIDCPPMWPTLERMRDLQLAPIVHVNAESSLEAPWRLQRLARDFPDLTFLAFDGLWSFERARHIFETAAQTPNIIWDFGGGEGYVGVEEWVARNGSETICFSADLSYGGDDVERPPLLGVIERARIGEAERENILGGNLRRLFRIA